MAGKIIWAAIQSKVKTEVENKTQNYTLCD